MKRSKLRIISAISAVVILISIIPTAALAAGLENFTQKGAYQPSKFSDVGENDWFYNNVKSAYEAGLMEGKSADKFDPSGNVKLSEVITIAVRLHSIYLTGDDAIAEVASSSHWYDKYVAYAKKNNIISAEYADIEARATRAQFAEILAAALPDEALASMNTVDDDTLPDVKITDECGSAVYKLYRAGVLTGNDSKGKFTPASGIQRSEVAAIVSRMANESLRVRFDMISYFGVVRHDFDEHGNIIKETSYDENGKLKDRWDREYDEQDRLIYEKFSSGKHNEFTYDERGDLVEIRSYQSDGALNEKRAYTFNDKHQIIDVKLFGKAGEIETWESYAYDADGNRTSTSARDSYGKVIYSIARTYDKSGRITSKAYKNASGKAERTLDIEYSGTKTAKMHFNDGSGKLLTEFDIKFAEDGTVTTLAVVDHDVYTDVNTEYTFEYFENGYVSSVALKLDLLGDIGTYKYECAPKTTTVETLIKSLFGVLEVVPFVESDKI